MNLKQIGLACFVLVLFSAFVGIASAGYIDTGEGTYPSIAGIHNGTITPKQTINVSRMFTYSCPGTGGHSEYVAFYNTTTGDEIANGTWTGYQGAGDYDYHYITFEEPFVLEKDVTYNYTIRTGSYPLIIHKQNHTTLDGSLIMCEKFVDVNGKSHDDWIPAIRLEGIPPEPPAITDVTVNFTNSTYKNVTVKPTGWFETGQEADIVLNWFGFNKSGGALSFNHPATLATDGEHLLLADTWNNRILIWNNLPQGNEPPDIVLGQKDFLSNEPGIGPDRLNWPVGVATDGKRVIVADTCNNRVLIWNEFPTENGEPADLVLGAPNFTSIGKRPDPIPPNWQKTYIFWPWAVWTDSTRLVVTSTRDGRVLIWNSFPARNCQPADILLTGGGNFGTPRAIGSDGTCLIIGDHNSKVNNAGGDFFWRKFPATDDEPYDFFMTDPINPGNVIWGLAFSSQGKLLGLAGPKLLLWNSFPEGEFDLPDLILDFEFDWGDGGGIAIAGDKVYVSMPNGHRIVVFNSIPSTADQLPDFSIGSPGIFINPFTENYFIGNPVVSSDGEHLFAISDFSRKMCVWKKLPNESGAKPDIVYSFPFQPWDLAVHNGKLIVAGEDRVYIWNKLPLDGSLPDVKLEQTIGSVRFTSIGGVELDDKYFYLADQMERKLYIWEGIPDESIEPKFILDVPAGVSRLSSDGMHLTTLSAESAILIFSVDGIPKNEEPLRLAEILFFQIIVQHLKRYNIYNNYNKYYQMCM